MAITNYTELQAALTRYLRRGDLAASLPDFITLAEAKLNRLLRTQQMEKQASGTLSSAELALPADCLEIRQLDIAVPGGVLRTRYVTPEQFAEQAVTAGTPAYFTVIGRTLRLNPAPQGNGYTLTYFGQLPALSPITVDNWLLLSAPDAYLYGALAEAAPYLKDDGRLAVWKQQFAEVIGDLQQADKRVGSAQLTIRTS